MHTCLAMAGSEMTTNDCGPNDSLKMGPYTLNNEYRGTNTGWSTISRMSPLALGISAAARRDHSCPASASFFAIQRPEILKTNLCDCVRNFESNNAQTERPDSRAVLCVAS